MAFVEEGVGSTTERLEQLWRSHALKLDALYGFLIEERGWFDVEPPDPNVKAAASLREIIERVHQIGSFAWANTSSGAGSTTWPLLLTDTPTLRACVNQTSPTGSDG